MLSTFDVKRLKAMIAARRENYYLSDLNDELLIMLQGKKRFLRIFKSNLLIVVL